MYWSLRNCLTSVELATNAQGRKLADTEILAVRNNVVRFRVELGQGGEEGLRGLARFGF